MVRLVLDSSIQFLRWLSQATAEIWDQRTVLGMDMNHQQMDDPQPESSLCVPGWEHDIAPPLHSTESLASDTLSVDSIPMKGHFPQSITSPQVCAAELETPTGLDDLSAHDLVPSPTPSEHGSFEPASINRESHFPLESHLPLSPSTSEGSADYFSDVDRSSGPSSPLSEHSIIFVSTESIPEYLRENHAYLVATSAPSRPSSVASSYIRLPSVATSLDCMPPQEDHELTEASLSPSDGPSRLYCRACLRDPCDDLTATMCGHLFCNRFVAPFSFTFLHVDVGFLQMYHRCCYDQVCLPGLYRSNIALLSFSP